MILLAPAVYDVHGLRIRTTLALGAPVAAGDDFDVDLSLGPPAPVPAVAPEGGRVMAANRSGGALRYVAVADGPVTTLRVPGVCDFVIGPDPAAVECRPDPAADLGLLAILATGLLVGYLVIAAGDCVLHASAVEVDGAAVAFLGPSGMGKSTVVTLCCAAGALLVTDDVLRLDTSGPVIECVGGSGQIRLRPHAAWALDQFSAPPPTTPSADGRVLVMPAITTASRLPLATIVLLRPNPVANTVTVRALGGTESFVRVMAELRVGGWEDESVGRRLFATVARVVDQVPVLEADIPWGPAFEAAVGPLLVDLAHPLP
ncbi:MAG: hypothetical protein QOG82_173 [Actinomycetota bacterium]|jgi:hypothetical protein|nr:hypothetical protein [Actinomycetota bacterium]